MTNRNKPTMNVTISKSLDDKLSLVNNKSKLVDAILSEMFVENNTTIKALEAICGGIDNIPWALVINNGLQNTYDKLSIKSGIEVANEQINFMNSLHKPLTKYFVVKEALTQKPTTWNELTLLVAKLFPEFDVNELSIEAFARTQQYEVSQSQKHRFRDDWLYDRFNVMTGIKEQLTYK